MKTEGFLSSPLVINWALTNKCTFRCGHCYSRTDTSEELDSETLLGAIARAAKAGVLSLNFGGGEPLLREDLLEVAKFSSGKGLKVSMNTNGFLVKREVALSLKEAGFSKVGVSIDSHLPSVHDGFRGVRGSHERAVRALRHLNEAGIETSISTVICRINHAEPEALVQFAIEHGARQLNFHNFKCTGLGYSNKDKLDLSAAEWEEFYRRVLPASKSTDGLSISLEDPVLALLDENRGKDSLVKGSVCGKISLNIKSNGDITPCGFIPITIGNILKDDLRQVWRDSPVLERMRNKRPRGKCHSCDRYEECLGGCTARALALTGDMNNPDPHCWRNG